VVNGSESYEHHYSYDINPIVWLGTGLKLVLGCGHTDNEVVVCAPAYRCSPQPTQYQGSVGYQYYSQPNYSGYVQHGYSTVYGYDETGMQVLVTSGYPGWFWYGNQWHRNCPRIVRR
jgi:hypothetical protein